MKTNTEPPTLAVVLAALAAFLVALSFMPDF